MESTSPQPAHPQTQPHNMCSFQTYSEYLKTEDTPAPSTSPALSDNMEYTMQSIPALSSQPDPIVIASRPAKKRKSWGQKLPEPKTKLPPRRRAKTEDEKEQRRIERIARNRAAAHNSRERKRQETEDLAVALARANAELKAYKTLHGPLPSHIVLPEVHVAPESSDPVTVDTPAPSLADSHGTHGDAPSPRSPADDIFQFKGVPQIKEELDELDMSTLPTADTPPFTESVYGQFDEKSSVPMLSGPMQDSAASVQQQTPQFDYSQYSILSPSLTNGSEYSIPAMLPNHHDCSMEGTAFTSSGHDTTLGEGLFNWEDFINDSSAVYTAAVRT